MDSFVVQCLILGFLTLAIFPAYDFRTIAPKCGYDACDPGKPDMLNVHLVPHTHDDVGWLKTVDQYYYGYRNNIQHAGIQYIIDNVVRELLADPAKRFMYVEIAYFYRWWNEQTAAMQTSVRQLVNEGRLQFILGGWCMNDEATTHYAAIVDQHTRGLKFLKDNFGECGRPLTAWQIDPFGHSREQANLFAQMGYDSLYFMRLDFRDKQARLAEKRMQTIWRGSNDSGAASDLFTSVFFGPSYCPPVGFCFDTLCNDDPIMDDPRMHDQNVKSKVDHFLAYVAEHRKHFTSNHIIVPMGCDFQFENARMNYKNMGKLIRYTNARQATGSKVNLIYSNPSCHSLAVNKANLTYTGKSDDFFPYADGPHSYWTGYFTSRAALKGYVRQSNSFLQTCQQISVLSGISSDAKVQDKVDFLRRSMGLVQHHDGVSGTEKQQVAYDYAERLAEGIKQCEDVVSMGLSKLTGGSVANDTQFNFCTLQNISQCEFTESGSSFTAVIYNPLSWTRAHWVRLPVLSTTGHFSVVDKNGKPILSQIIPITKRTMSIPERKSKANMELVFQATLPALGFSSFNITKVNRQDSSIFTPLIEFNKKGLSDLVISNEFIQLTFDQKTGQINKMTNRQMGYSIPLQQSMQYYFGYLGNNLKPENRASGAYAFRPANQTAFHFPKSTITNYVTGPLVQEVHQHFDDWATQVIRLYRGEPVAEIEWTVGPIPDQDKKGREVILNYETGLKSVKTFFTDANGRQLVLRKRDSRSYPFKQDEPVSGNYYPINSRIFVGDAYGDKPLQFLLFTDRSQGGGSIRDGQVEVMVHRRTMDDDNFGVGEPLKENGADGKGLIIRGKHYIALENATYSYKFHRNIAQAIFLQPTIAFTSLRKLTKPVWTAIKKQLPPSLHLMTLDEWDSGSKLIRIEHIFETREDPKGLSKPQWINLQDLFVDFKLTAIEELSLGANQNLKDMKRLVWRYSDGRQTSSAAKARNLGVSANPFNITLNPMEIRTFQIWNK